MHHLVKGMDEWFGHQRDHRWLMVRFSDALINSTCASLRQKCLFMLVYIDEG